MHLVKSFLIFDDHETLTYQDLLDLSERVGADEEFKKFIVDNMIAFQCGFRSVDGQLVVEKNKTRFLFRDWVEGLHVGFANLPVTTDLMEAVNLSSEPISRVGFFTAEAPEDNFFTEIGHRNLIDHPISPLDLALSADEDEIDTDGVRINIRFSAFLGHLLLSPESGNLLEGVRSGPVPSPAQDLAFETDPNDLWTPYVEPPKVDPNLSQANPLFSPKQAPQAPKPSPVKEKTVEEALDETRKKLGSMFMF